MDQLTLEHIDILDSRNLDRSNIAVHEYVEFIVNGEPLSGLLDDFFEPDVPLLSKFTSTLGTMEMKNFDRLKVKQLLGHKMTSKELQQLFPSQQFDHEPILKELALGKVLIYCCAECGDYQCGGYFARITENENSFTWTFEQRGKEFRLEFDKDAYCATFVGYLEELSE